jgi:hypothetical protein
MVALQLCTLAPEQIMFKVPIEECGTMKLAQASQLPSLHVSRKLNDGFQITSKGYLGWINLPKASECTGCDASWLG